MTVTREMRLDEPPPEETAGRPDGREAVDFDGLYHAHFRSLTLQLAAYCGDLSQAQDLVQEAFCRAFARWSRVSRYDDPVAWVRRVAAPWTACPPGSGRPTPSRSATSRRRSTGRRPCGSSTTTGRSGGGAT